MLSNLAILAVLLVTGAHLYLLPRRLWPLSHRPLRSVHMLLAVAYLTKFFAEVVVGAFFA